MSQHLLSLAEQRAERSDPPVKAAALLCIARVWTAFHQEKARVVLEKGIAAALELSEPDRSITLKGAVSLAATVSPSRALQLAASLGPIDPATSEKLVFDMLRHGHIRDAVDYVCNPKPGDGYPFAAVGDVMSHLSDEETHRSILRAATSAWVGGVGEVRNEKSFLRLFATRWNVLPRLEAQQSLRTIIRRILDETDQRTNASFSFTDSRKVEFSSRRQCRLFEIFGPLKQLDPELATSLSEQYSQLATATEQFPTGYWQALEIPDADAEVDDASAPAQPNDYITVGNDWIPLSGDLESSFPSALDIALELYAKDVATPNGNAAPQGCWPSTNGFRTILYKAGEYRGLGASRYLERVTNTNLRLFAEIEMIAAISGVPQIGYISLSKVQRDG
jgi:hypothetical protein